jgi:hypothetical protein
MNEKLQRFQARARELARSGKFIGWRPIAFELQFEEGFTDAIQWTYSASTQEELDIICRESRGSHDQNQPSKSLGTFPTATRFSPLTGRQPGKGGRSMAYALGGVVLLGGVILYATVETRFELRRDQQQLQKMVRDSGTDRPGTLTQ